MLWKCFFSLSQIFFCMLVCSLHSALFKIWIYIFFLSVGFVKKCQMETNNSIYQYSPQSDAFIIMNNMVDMNRMGREKKPYLCTHSHTYTRTQTNYIFCCVSDHFSREKSIKCHLLKLDSWARLSPTIERTELQREQKNLK